ncbi:MAG: hypothetical protein KTR24_03605 [Saprospiraceae bacterium]|nr:hypothetical protein [Saprospiraceae bacterium]
MITTTHTKWKGQVLFSIALTTFLCPHIPWALSATALDHHVWTTDTVDQKELAHYAKPFQLLKGRLTGEGADILEQVLDGSQVLMLGNHHRSHQEEMLAMALSRHFHQSGGKRLILEIGPLSRDVLVDQLSRGQSATAALLELNRTYGMTKEGRFFAPIPDLKSLGAARHLDSLHTKGWSIHALGYDSWTAFSMIIDFLYASMSPQKQSEHVDAYTRTMALLDRLYAEMNSPNNAEVLQLTTALKSSTLFNQFIDMLEQEGTEPSRMEALRFSLDYWHWYGQRRFYDKNKANAKRNKVLLSQILERAAVDLNEDKLMVSMWRQHMTKGRTANGFYGVGNTLNELAEMNGHTANNIAIIQRYHRVDGILQDRLEADDPLTSLFVDFLPFGEKHQHVLIDLRKFNKEFYWEGYHIPEKIEKIFERYDLLIIAKTDEDAAIND